MHKKLEADLISLAHRILKIKGKSDVFTLQRLSKDIYEKLSLLAFVEEYVNHTPGIKATKEELTAKIVEGLEMKAKQKDTALTSDLPKPEKIVHQLTEEPNLKPQEDQEKNEKNTSSKPEENPVVEITEQPFDELETLMFEEPKTAPEEVTSLEQIDKAQDQAVEVSKTPLDEELQDTISVDVMADLFENAQPKSLNEKLTTTIQIGLNDRIAFVKHLFNGEQEDYNRVISQLNTFKTEKEVHKFINEVVKPDYDWSDKEDLETRFLDIIIRKFA